MGFLDLGGGIFQDAYNLVTGKGSDRGSNQNQEGDTKPKEKAYYDPRYDKNSKDYGKKTYNPDDYGGDGDWMPDYGDDDKPDYTKYIIIGAVGLVVFSLIKK